MNKQYVVVVDPFSSGGRFAERISKNYSLSVVALITTKKLPDVVFSTFKEQDYEHVFYYEDSVGVTASEIEGVMGGRPLEILCGSEPGVIIFDQFVDHWGFKSNDQSKSQARRNKFDMALALMESGVPHAKFYLSDNAEDIVDWSIHNGICDVVVKPIMSFATDGVFFCRGPEQLRENAQKLLGSKDYSGNYNNKILAQELLYGDEFVVDSVSMDGKHYVVNIFRYEKYEVLGVPLYRTMKSESVNDHPELCSYIGKCLDALGISYGPSHSEVIMTNKGPRLVETGARMHGGLGPVLVEMTNSVSLIDLSIASRLDSVQFIKETSMPPRLDGYAVEYFLSAGKTGIVVENRVESQSKTLPSYYHHSCNISCGEPIKQTVDLVTTIGRVVLFNKDKATLENDLLTLKQLDIDSELVVID
ncbi:ATP-grasp domain-containing protein [Aeromonas veronii]